VTLFTLNNDRKQLKKTMFTYVGIVIFCMIFGVVYEVFSHGVISHFMLHGFFVPLVLGLIPYLILFLLIKGKGPGMVAGYLYNAGVATISVGTYFKGMLDIYGTTRIAFVIIYYIIGGLLLVTGITLYIISLLKREEI